MSKLALVTGASSGIGNAYALELLRQEYDLIVVGRRRERLDELAASGDRAGRIVEPLVADLATADGIDAVAELAGARPLTMLVNNAGVAHYMPFAELPREKAWELVFVKELAPTMITRAAVPGMLERREGTIINVAGMIAFSGPARPEQLLERQGLDLSAVPRMSPADVVTASLRGLELGEVVCAPGVERADLLHAAFDADLAAFGAQRPELAQRYRSDPAPDQ